MDTMNQVNKLWKELQDSTREFVHLGLQMGAKGLDFAATQLKSVEESLKKSADKFATKVEHTVEKVDAKIEEKK
jgi:hypothetical protein